MNERVALKEFTVETEIFSVELPGRIIKRLADEEFVPDPEAYYLLIIPLALVVSRMHSASWWYDPGGAEGYRYDSWHSEYLLYALALAAIVVVVFTLIEERLKRKSR